MNVEIREGSVQAAVLAYLGQRGDCFFWRANTGGMRQGNSFIRFGRKGQSDILGCQFPGGRMFGVECKRPRGGVESKDQREFGEALRAAGGIYVLAHSVDEVAAALGPVAAKIQLPQRKRVFPP